MLNDNFYKALARSSEIFINPDLLKVGFSFASHK